MRGSARSTAVSAVLLSCGLQSARGLPALRLQWEPVKSGSYCVNQSDPFAEDGGAGSWPPRALSGGYVCLTHESGRLREESCTGDKCAAPLSPLEFADTVAGRVATATLNNGSSAKQLPSQSCAPDDDATSGCSGHVEMDLTAADELQFEWTAGAELQWEMWPPLGDMIATFALQGNDSAACSPGSFPLAPAAQCKAGSPPAGKCCAELPADFYPIGVSDTTGRETSTQLAITAGKMLFRVGMYTSYSGSMARFNSVSMRCAVGTLPAACGGVQRWAFSLPPRLTRASRTEVTGFTVVHPLSFTLNDYPKPGGALDWDSYAPLTDDERLMGRADVASMSVTASHSDPCSGLGAACGSRTLASGAGPCEEQSGGGCAIAARPAISPPDGCCSGGVKDKLKVLVNATQVYSGAPRVVGAPTITVSRSDGSPLGGVEPACRAGVCELSVPAPAEVTVTAQAKVAWEVCSRSGASTLCQDLEFWTQATTAHYKVERTPPPAPEDDSCVGCVVVIVLIILGTLCLCCGLGYWWHKQRQPAAGGGGGGAKGLEMQYASMPGGDAAGTGDEQPVL